MKKFLVLVVLVMLAFSAYGQSQPKDTTSQLTAEDILGNPNYLAFSYGGYRGKTRDDVPSVDDLKEDMKILSAMGVKIIRTYNTQKYAQTENLLKAIRQLNFQSNEIIRSRAFDQAAGNICLIIKQFDNPFYSDIAEGVKEYADKFSSYGISGIFKSFTNNPMAFVKRNKYAVIGTSVILIGIGVGTYLLIKNRK